MKASTLLLGAALLGIVPACLSTVVLVPIPANSTSDAGTDAVVAADVPIVSDVATESECAFSNDTVTSDASSVNRAAQQLMWVLTELNGADLMLDDTLIDDHLTPSYLALNAFPNVIAQFNTMSRTVGMVTLVRIETGASDTSLVADCVGATGIYLRISLTTDGTSSGYMAALTIAIDPTIDPTLGSWSAIESRLGMLAPEVHLLATEITSGAPVTLYSITPTVQGPVSTAFRVYVLSALASQIESGVRAWTDTVPITENWKSLAPGTWQSQPDGTLYSLQDFAMQMISENDCTATDHLLQTVGVGVVGGVLPSTPPPAANLNAPLLTTREFFQLKLSVPADQQMMYVGDNVASRSAFLASTVDPMDLTAATAAVRSWTSPILVDQIEWFASPTDLTNAMVIANTLPEPIPNALEAAGWGDAYGLFVNTPVFPNPGFVSGAEPGVLSMTWLLGRMDGRSFVVSVNIENPTGTIDGLQARYLALAVIDLVGMD